jgi:FMN-dependent NADH-azoreductase
MAKLIHIQASPRGSRSASRAVAACFIESYRATHPGDTVDTLDLWQADLSEIDGAVLDAAYAVKHRQPHSPEQLHVWQAIVRLADHFKSADKYLVSLPMWNFSIPYKLKHYIDLLVHRGLTFSFTPEEGYKGLVISRASILNISSVSLASLISARFSSSQLRRILPPRRKPWPSRVTRRRKWLRIFEPTFQMSK